jgi:hypothetical protein
VLIALRRCWRFDGGFVGRGPVLGEEFPEGGFVVTAGVCKTSGNLNVIDQREAGLETKGL